MNNYEEAMNKINNADAVLISASNGLSISEGYHIFADNNDFKKYFGEFREKYHIPNIIQGVFAQIPNEDHEKFMNILKDYMVTDYHGSTVFENLKKIVDSKDYFIITSNADTHFQINGFDENKIFEIEGNFFGLQERSPEWQQQYNNYQEFMQKYKDKNIVILELGIGRYNQMIKEPLMQLVLENKSYGYITLNIKQEIYIPQQIAERSVAVEGNIAESFEEMLKYKE